MKCLESGTFLVVQKLKKVKRGKGMLRQWSLRKTSKQPAHPRNPTALEIEQIEFSLLDTATPNYQLEVDGQSGICFKSSDSRMMKQTLPAGVARRRFARKHAG